MVRFKICGPLINWLTVKEYLYQIWLKYDNIRCNNTHKEAALKFIVTKTRLDNGFLTTMNDMPIVTSGAGIGSISWASDIKIKRCNMIANETNLHKSPNAKEIEYYKIKQH